MRQGDTSIGAEIVRALSEGVGLTAVVLIGVGLLLLVALLFAMLILARRKQGTDIREIVLAVEDLRSGQLHRRPDVDSRSQLAMLSDAVHRLGQDLGVRWKETEGAGLQLHAVLDAARDIAVLATDTDGDVKSFSPGASALFGWEEEALWGRPVSVLFTESSWKDFLPKLTRRRLREQGIETRAGMRRHDGGTFDGRLAVRALRGPTGEITGFLMVVRDISAQARLERDLRASEERYRSLVEGLSEGVFILQQGRLVYANPALAELCGADVATMPATLWRDYVAAKDVLLAQERLADLEDRPNERVDLHLALRGAEGRPRAEVRVRAAVVEYAGKAAVLGTVEDETEERRIDAELRQNESQLDAVLEATSEGILVMAQTVEGGVVHLTNRAFLELFNLGEREVLGASEGQLLRLLRERGEGAETVAAFLAASTHEPRSETVTLDGEGPRELEVMAAPLRDRTGAILGKILASRDLTDQRASERDLEVHIEELQRSKQGLEQAYGRVKTFNEDLRGRSEELEKLNRELRSLDEMKTNLLGNVSHELQTPLVSIRGYTEMILRGRLGAITQEQHKGLQLSLKNIDRLISMIDNLLTFSRMNEEVGRIKLSTFPLRPLVEESVDLLREGIEAKRIEFSSAFESLDVMIHGDRDMILQVLLNLLSNAIKFNRDDGKVEIVVRSGRPGFAVVQVEDTGIGIPEADLERIFDRFYQSKVPVGTAGEGSGLGLSIVRNILRLHGCSIRVESREGEGSTFSFTLPLAGEKTRAGENDEPSPEPQSNRPVDGVAGGVHRSSESPRRSSSSGSAPAETTLSAPDESTPTTPGAPRLRLRIIRRSGSESS